MPSERKNAVMRPTSTNKAVNDTELMVVMKKEYSNPYYHMTLQHFPDINALELKEYMKADKSDNDELIDFQNYRNILKFTFENNDDLEEAISILSTRADIQSVSYNFLLEIEEEPITTEITEYNGKNRASLNDNTSWDYSIEDMNMFNAWTITEGSKGVKIGIMDLGCMITHEALVDNIWINQDEIPNNNIDDDNNGFIDDIYGWNFANNSNDVSPATYHGTACAGCAGGAKGNSEIIGTAPIVSLVTLNTAYGDISSSRFIDLIDYAHKEGIFILSMSYGIDGISRPAEYSALSNYNGLMLCSAGNKNSNNDIIPHNPSSYDLNNIVAVAASNSSGLKASFSNYGLNSVDVAAPGASIRVCNISSSNSYTTKNGTSFATPKVAGVAALLKSYQPEATPMEIKNILINTVNTSPDAFNGITVSGGRVDAYAALLRMKEMHPRKITWDFNDMTVGSINKTHIENFLTYCATNSKRMSIENCSKSLNGHNYIKRLKLEGDGNLNERSVSFDVCGDTSIYITANAHENRILNLTDSSGNILDTFNVTPNVKVFRYLYEGTYDKLYLYSDDSNINIYEISVEERNADDEEINKEWLFSDTDFCSHSYITDDEIDGLTIKNGTISNNNVTVDNTKYTHYLGLAYSGTNDNYTAKFEVPGDCLITLVGRSTGNQERNILVLNEKGYVVATMPVTNTASEQTFRYTGNADTLYIRSQSGGIRLYDIDVKSVEAEPRVIRADRTGYATAPTNVGAEIEISTDNQIAARSYDNVVSGSAFEISDDIISGSAISVMRSPSNNRNSTLNSDFKYYDQLSAPQKQIYNAMYQKLTSHPARDNNLRLRYTINVTDNASNRATLRQNIKSALSALLNDHPEFFRIYSYNYCFNTNSGNILNIQYYLTNYPELANATVATNNVNAKIDDISEDVDTSEIRFSSDYDLVNQLIDLFNDEYTLVDTNAGYDNQSNAAGALYNGYADSFGAAQAFKLLCDYNDISCIYAEGYAGNSNAAFNLVQLEGEWFLCDVTSANNKLTKLPSNYALMNPSIYGDNSSNVRIFTYPTINASDYMILGDANLDSVLDASDSAWVLQYVLNPSVINLNTKAKLRSDTDFDGELTANDSAIILQMVLNGSYHPTPNGVRSVSRNTTVDYEEFVEIYNSLSDQLGTDYITVEELREIFDF